MILGNFFLRKRLILGVIALFFVCFVTIMIISAYPINDSSMTLRYIKKIGESVGEQPISIEKIRIPDGFSDVYENYNALQKEAGFDLYPYRGKTVTKYTFENKNDHTYIHILVHNKTIIGGDIMTVELDGFMLPLKKREN